MRIIQCYELNWAPSKSTCWSPNLQCASIWRWAFDGVIKLQWGHKGRAIIQQDWCPSKKRKRHQEGICAEGRPSASQEERSQRPTLLATPFGMSSLQNHEKTHFSCSSLLVCDTLLGSWSQIIHRPCHFQMKGGAHRNEQGKDSAF